jgi:hypothetical protein
VAMVLVARETARGILPGLACHPLVCDLATADDLPETLAKMSIPAKGRLLTFFGMLPNFEPEIILPRLTSLLGNEDKLLLSANLAPGSDYAEGVRKILPLYDNPLTREWLMMFLTDVGIENADVPVQSLSFDFSGFAEISVSGRATGAALFLVPAYAGARAEVGEFFWPAAHRAMDYPLRRRSRVPASAHGLMAREASDNHLRPLLAQTIAMSTRRLRRLKLAFTKARRRFARTSGP